MPRDAKTLKPTKPEVKYLVKHDGPNRALRRRAKAILIIRQKRFDTWWRELVRAGVDPKKVLLARQIRENARIVAGKTAEQATEQTTVEERASDAV